MTTVAQLQDVLEYILRTEGMNPQAEIVVAPFTFDVPTGMHEDASPVISIEPNEGENRVVITYKLEDK